MGEHFPLVSQKQNELISRAPWPSGGLCVGENFPIVSHNQLERTDCMCKFKEVARTLTHIEVLHVLI